MINSRLSLFTAAHLWAPLLPKLRGDFAEFLNKGSPVRLRIFSSSTCVGLRYGHLGLFSSFSRQCEFICFPTLFRSPSRPSLRHAYFTTCQPHRLNAYFHQRAQTILLCPCFINNLGGAGISTSCPSSTPFGLNLGPDLPWADEPSPGNLRLSTAKILTLLSLLMPAFSLVCRPRPLSIPLLPSHIAPLPMYYSIHPQTSVYSLSPGTSSAHPRSTSELLRTLLMSGCF